MLTNGAFSNEKIQRVNLVGDLAILTATSFFATYDGGEVHWRVALAMSGVAGLLWLFASRVIRQYDARNGRGFFGDIALTLFLVAGVAIPMVLLRYVSPKYGVTARLHVFCGILLPAILWLRLRVVGLRLWNSRRIEQILVLGAGPLGRITQREIDERGQRRGVMGHLRFDDETPQARLRAPVLGTVAELERVLKEKAVDEVYVATTGHAHSSGIQAAIGTCEKFGVPFALPISSFRMSRAKPVSAQGGSDGYVHYSSVPHKPLQMAVKRLIDIVASAVALLVLSPLLVTVAILIKLTSRGPVLFRQQRTGLYGRAFSMLKFRSMVVDAEKLKELLMAKNEQTGPVFKMKNDPRITAIGRFIRKYSIDELPQLVNVLRGDMSIVGPRPPLPTEVLRYEAWQRRRLSVRPGLTCVWQVSGRNQISFEQWMLLDMQYIDHWSLVQDMQLILKTAPVVLTGRGAS
jgi:exopolysaccharide biosynthesis polyprenyl glycosylphosphotransferase